MHDLLSAEIVLGLESFCKFQGIEGGLVVARVAEVVPMDMDGMRQTEILVCLDQAGDDLCRGDIEIRDRVIDGETVQSPCPGFSSAGVDDLDTISLGLVESPCNIRCIILDLMVLEILEHEPVVAEDRECGFVNDRGIVDLFVHMACIERGHCCFHRECVTPCGRTHSRS